MSRLEKISLVVFAFIAFSYIISSSYLGVNGNHSWRQSDVYGHILGFTGTKDFTEYDRFIAGSKAVFDVPIYPYVVAKVSLFISSDPLVVTRFINLMLWLITAFAGYKLCRLLGNASAGLVFVYLLATSPLILHYYSVPLPDVMSIAFSLMGIVLLHVSNRSWKGLLYSLPFLAIATLIKSPIVFVFLVFYVVYALLNIDMKRPVLHATLSKYAPFITSLIILFGFTIYAEQLRKLLLNLEGAGFAQDPTWYFGTWELRTSIGFWNVLWDRFHIWGPVAFGYIYLVVIAIAALLDRGKQHLTVTAASIVAFFSGWLVFSNVYEIHDYYQLPVTVVIFISFAISLSNIFRYAIERIPVPAHSKLETIGMILIVPLSFAQVLTQQSLSSRSRANIYSGIEYALRDQNIFLYVSDYEHRSNNPRPGGRVSTKFHSVSLDDFENNCDEYLSDYSAVLADDYSNCLAYNKKYANYFVQDSGITFYLNSNTKITSKLGIAQDHIPSIDSVFQVFFDGQQLVYLKPDCVKKDIDARFFLHVTPSNNADLPSNSKHGFQNMDFNFFDHGKVIDGVCVAVRNLPSYKIKSAATGQYIPNKGRTWGGLISPTIKLRLLMDSRLIIDGE